MEIKESCISGCLEITSHIHYDERGFFVKTFNYDIFSMSGLISEWKEDYYSVSKKGVLRGLHFQMPPYDHEKMVYCTEGSVLDAVVDLRSGSPTYGWHVLFEVSEEKANMIYIPRGLAHGFYVLSERATMVYKVSSVYAPEYDSGIHWKSAGIPWPDDKPIISKRDNGFEQFRYFNSPFYWSNNS
jgi:dTDP-4-dehydrorhamnose 3,5-epimerase